jgi:hypothetical protein
MNAAASSAAAAELQMTLGQEKVATSAHAIERMLRDQSWLSPVLRDDRAIRGEQLGPTQGVQAVVAPTSLGELTLIAACAARYRVPLTVRGAATSNFGLIAADHGGIIVDMRRLRSEPAPSERSGFSALAGTTHGAFERVARQSGREMPVLTTTFATATIAGWLAGGHVGLGSGCHGAIWDGLVHSVRLVTVEETPRHLELAGTGVNPVLHTFGAGGLISEVTLASEAKHDWIEAVAFFAHYEDAASFVTELSLDRNYRHRAATAQEAGLTPGLTALKELGRKDSCTLLIIDEAQFDAVSTLASAHKGEILRWQSWSLPPQARPSIASMVYGHRMLWVKQLLPGAAFAHIYFDPVDPLAGQKALKARFGDDLLMETKFIRSPWMIGAMGFDESSPALAASVVVIVDGRPEKVREVLACCEHLGLRYQNSHTNIVEDNGLFRDVSDIVEHKSRVDPYNLVNRGRLRSAKERA